MSPSIDAADERRAVRVVRNGCPVQGRAAGDVGRVGRHHVGHRHVGDVFRTRVLHRDRVAQRLAGEQDVRVTFEVGRDLVDVQVRSRLDQDLGRILVTADKRVRRPIDIRIVTDRNGIAGIDRLRLVQYRRIVGDRACQLRFEYDLEAVT